MTATLSSFDSKPNVVQIIDPRQVPYVKPTLSLNDGTLLPRIGLGTRAMNDLDVQAAVSAALELGYRLIDTASDYDNELGVGAMVTPASSAPAAQPSPPARPIYSRRKWLLVAIAIAAIAAGLWIWRAMVARQDSGELVLYGNVDIHQVSLAFNASERIDELRVREGDRVKTGDVLGALDQRTARVHLAQTQAQIGAQEQALLRLKTGSRPQEIKQARANLAAAEADAELATLQVERLRAIGKETDGRAISQQDLDSALARQKSTRAQAQSARAAAELVIQGPRKEDIAQATRQLASVHADQALIQRQIDESELHAPVDGVVRARLLEVGDIASPQRPVYTLAITQPKWVRAYVPEARLSQLMPGMAASVTTDADPQQSIAARLGYISSIAEFTPKTVQTEELRTSLVYEVRFMIDDPEDRLRLGMPATVHLVRNATNSPERTRTP
jgi:HlyD family secretion protein